MIITMTIRPPSALPQTGPFILAPNHYSEADHNGVRTGKGILIFADGDMYEGNFIDNEFSGYGEYLSMFGFIHRGNFSNGSPSGAGTRVFINGERFVAEWTTWIDGIGIYYFLDGSTRFTHYVSGIWR
jgi:hypothetical protein